MKIYSDIKYLEGFNCHMMIPFWGHIKDEFDVDNSRFDKYEKLGKDFFTLVGLEDAEFVVYPKPPFGKGFLEFQEITNPKKMIVFFNHDCDDVLNYRENTYVFRTSFYKSTQRLTEFAIPGWSADNGALGIRKWTEKPVVSFCGSLDNGTIRSSGLDAFEQSSKIKTNYIVRTAFWGGVDPRMKNIQKTTIVRKEFINNMDSGDYAYCVRGGNGNFSYRIYEAMSYGRIPVLLNTDCVFPYDFIVDWGKVFPIIDIKDVKKAPEILMEFHNSIRNDFEERQFMIRSLYDEYISPVGFFKNLHKHF